MAALRRDGAAGAALAIVAWGSAAASFALFGHAATATPRWLTAPAVALHAGAFIFWLGALPGLAERATGPQRDLMPALHRFSKLAVPLVGLLVLSGATIMAVQIPRPAALLDTDYGRLLTAKLLAAGLLLGLAALNRLWFTPAIERGALPAATWFRRSVLAEIVLGLIILGLASGFRLTPPPRSVLAAAPSALHLHLHGSTLTAAVSIVPGRAGTNTVEIDLASAPAAPIDPLEVRIAFADPAQAVGADPGRSRPDRPDMACRPALLPYGGDWSVRLEVLVSDFVEETLEESVTVGRR